MLYQTSMAKGKQKELKHRQKQTFFEVEQTLSFSFVVNLHLVEQFKIQRHVGVLHKHKPILNIYEDVVGYNYVDFTRLKVLHLNM